ncbi:glycosyltransferase [Phormidium sp. LEGE 05292]|uniref:glycosyltransferase family 10 domain-containing protein n=1 Tax=[Phormidium] sp. LEGE 05292 TaxID=767427 RepID=UPI0018804243|nr:glycosyltransferase family 10 [Phormidium sp. LEGE 05292]MBE9227743.1 glycosyltransferase [Phormidium sp. LEGE 05292]
MDKKIIGMLSGYPNLNQMDWLWQQTPHNFGVWGNIQMLAQAEKPDFLLLYNFAGMRKVTTKKFWFFKPERKYITYPQEEMAELLRGVPKEKVVFVWREPPLEEVVKRNIASYEWAKEYCGYISGPDDAAPNPDYMPAIWYHSNSFRELDEMGCPEKIESCSWITSGVNRTANHRQRLEFLRSLKSSEIKFGLYGRGLPDWAQAAGELNNKWYGMAPYYYNLAIENYADNDWYVSEKMWDALLAWCLPIYYGGSAADKLLPPGSFLRLPSLDEKGVAYIKEVTATPDAWYAAKEAIAQARQIILHKLNLLEWLSNFTKKFS